MAIIISTTVTKSFTAAQVRSLPSTALEILPATETLGYVGSPATIYVPVHAFLVATKTVLYTNLSAARLQLVWGSDASLTIANVYADSLLQAAGTQIVAMQIATESDTRATATPAETVPHSHIIYSSLRVRVDGQMQDNALALYANNNGAGDFADGDGALDITVLYYAVTL